MVEQAGATAKPVETTEAFGSSARKPFGSLLEQVLDHDMAFRQEGLQRSRFRSITGKRHHAGAIGQRHVGQRPADAGGCSGDEQAQAFEIGTGRHA